MSVSRPLCSAELTLTKEVLPQFGIIQSQMPWTKEAGYAFSGRTGRVQTSHQMALTICKVTKTFPEDERFGLIAQMRRAAYSISMNLAEGAGRLNSGEYRQFVGVARVSTSELKYQLLLAKDLGYIQIPDCENLRKKCERISQTLTALAKSLAGK